MSYNTQIVSTVSAWEDVTPHPHRFGGTEFNIGKVEVGHIHGSHMVDIPFTVKIREALVASGEAQPHHLLADSGWISFYLRRDEDVAQAVKLLRLSYLQKRLARAKGEARAAITQELSAMPIAEAVKTAALNREAAPAD